MFIYGFCFEKKPSWWRYFGFCKSELELPGRLTSREYASLAARMKKLRCDETWGLCLCYLDLSSLLLTNKFWVVRYRAPDIKNNSSKSNNTGALVLEILLQRWPMLYPLISMGPKILYESTDPGFLSDLQHPEPLDHGMTAQHSDSNVLVCKKFHICVRSSEHCLVEKVKQNLEPREYLALLLLAQQRKYQRWIIPSFFPAQAWQTSQGKGEGHQSLLTPISQWAEAQCPGREHMSWEGHAGCPACSFTWWETTDLSAAGLSSRPCRANVTERTPLAISCTPTPHSCYLLLIQVLGSDSTLDSGQTKSFWELETLRPSPATRIIVTLALCSGISSLQEMVWS